MAEGAPNNLTLSVLSGPSSGESYALEGAVGHVIMGSGESAHIQFDSPVVVENHVRLAIDEQGAAVAPASPDAAVFLNDDPVTEDTPLKNGDILWMGNPGDDGAVMIQCHLEPAAPAAEAVEEPVAPVVDPESGMIEPPVEAELEEAAYVDSAEPLDGSGAAAEDSGPVPMDDGGVVVDEAEMAPEFPQEPEPPAPEPMVDDQPAQEFAEAAEVPPTADDADQETVFLGAAEPPTVEAEVEPPGESPEPAMDVTPPDEPEPPAVEAAPPQPEAPAPPPMDEPQPWEEQPEDSVKAAWEVGPAPTPPPPPGREDLAPPETTPAEEPPPAAPPAPAPPVAEKPAKPPVRRPPSRPATRTTRPAARPAPPPASSSGKTMGIAAAVVVVVVGAVGAFFMFGRGGSEPAPTTPPVTVAQTLAPPTTLSVTDESIDEVPLDEMPDNLGEDGLTEEPLLDDTAATAPDPEPTPPPAQPVATPEPTPDRAAAARLLRERQTKKAPTPAPAPRSTPAPATPAPVAQPSAAERQAQQVATLLGQADQAMGGSDFARAESLYDAALKLEPANAKAKAGKTQAASNAAAANKKFVPGRTVYVSKGKKGSAPAGFSDGANDPKYKGSLTIEMTPPKVPAGAAFTAKVFMTNEGTKDIKPRQVTFTTRLNGKTASVNAQPKVNVIKPGQRALVAETAGTWQPGTRSWIFEAKITSDRGDSYRTRLTWK